MAYALNQALASEADKGQDLLRKLSEEDLTALARGVAAVDGLGSAARSAESFRDLLEQLNAEQTYVLGQALGIGVTPPGVKDSLAINRVLISTRMAGRRLASALPFAVEAGASATEIIYGAQFRNHALKAVLPPNAYRAYIAYGGYKTARDLNEIYGND